MKSRLRHNFKLKPLTLKKKEQQAKEINFNILTPIKMLKMRWQIIWQVTLIEAWTKCTKTFDLKSV